MAATGMVVLWWQSRQETDSSPGSAIRSARFITKVRMVWFPKDDQGLKAAYTEIQRHKAGRKARIGGTAEVIAGPAGFDDNLEPEP
jgi:hypothetical protein